MNKDDYQEAIELTPAQSRAWKQLERAVNRCKKEGVYFYQVLETVCGLNGKNVADVMTDVDKNIPGWELCKASCLQWLSYPTVSMGSPLADDRHYVRLKAEQVP